MEHSQASLIAFATIGTFQTVQELAGACLQSMEHADPEVVFEETLVLVSTATARALEVGLEAAPDAMALASRVTLSLPERFRDYVMGAALMMQQDAALLTANAEVLERLNRKAEFYQTHLPAGKFPGERVLTDKMALWMGRLSGPGLPETPDARLARLGLVDVLLTHLKLMLAFARKSVA